MAAARRSLERMMERLDGTGDDSTDFSDAPDGTEAAEGEGADVAAPAAATAAGGRKVVGVTLAAPLTDESESLDADDYADAPHGGAPQRSDAAALLSAGAFSGLAGSMPRRRTRRPYLDVTVETLPELRSQVRTLEERLAKISNEKRLGEIRHAAAVERYEQEVAALRDQAEADLSDVLRRQEEVEAAAPLLAEQMEAARDELRNFTFDEKKYVAARRAAIGSRTLREMVVVAIGDALADASSEADKAFKDAEAARAESASVMSELSTLRRDNVRLLAENEQLQEELDTVNTTAAARLERLQTDLRSSSTRAEVLHAKGQMFDEEKAARDAAEHRASEAAAELSSKAALLDTVTDERDRYCREARDQAHTTELLTRDKAHLEGALSMERERAERAEREAETLAQQLSESKASRAKLTEQLMETRSDTQNAYETRLQAELTRLQSQAKKDLDGLTTDAAVTHERETRLLREMRDVAAAEAERARADAREARDAHEALLGKHREAMTEAERRSTELWSEFKVARFELDRAKVLAEEQGSRARQASLEAEKMGVKLRVLTESYHELESSAARKTAEMEGNLNVVRERLRHYEELEREIDDAVLYRAKDSGEEEANTEMRWLEGVGGTIPTSMRRRVQQSVALARRCLKLQTEGEALEAELAKERSTVAELTDKVTTLETKWARAQQPASYLVASVQTAEAELTAARRRIEILETELCDMRERWRATEDANTSMASDMQRVLQERGAIDAMRNLLVPAAAAAKANAAANPSTTAGAKASKVPAAKVGGAGRRPSSSTGKRRV